MARVFPFLVRSNKNIKQRQIIGAMHALRPRYLPVSGAMSDSWVVTKTGESWEGAVRSLEGRRRKVKKW